MCLKLKIKKENVIRLFKQLFYMYECFIYIHVFVPLPCSHLGGQKQECYSFERELETAMSRHGLLGTKPLPERPVM